MKIGSKISVANNGSQIFVGRDGIGFVFVLRAGVLATRESLYSAAECVSVENRGEDWVVVESREVPQGAWDLASRELASRRELHLASSRRKCKSNSSYEAAHSRGVTVRIWSQVGQFVCDVQEWSNWQGDGMSRKDEAAFATLDEARKWSENRCETRPSFGDVEWC